MDRAIEDLTKAISLDPKDTRAPRVRGESYSKKGNLDRAIEDYTKAIELDPKDAHAYGTRGYAYWNKARGEAYGAKREWDRAIADYDARSLEHDREAKDETK